MSKLRVECREWRPLRKNSLCGFAAIHIAELRLTMREIAVHTVDGKAFAQPPSRPWIDKQGQAVRDARGKVQYSQLFEFDNSKVRTAWSDAVVAAVLEFDPHALKYEEIVG